MALKDLLAAHPARASFDLDELVAAIEAANDCVAHCSACADACLAEDMDMSSCVRTCRDCEDVCRATVAVLTRPTPTGEAWRTVVEACIAVCEECAQECESHDDDHCRACAEACRTCADACRKLLAVAD